MSHTAPSAPRCGRSRSSISRPTTQKPCAAWQVSACAVSACVAMRPGLLPAVKHAPCLSATSSRTPAPPCACNSFGVCAASAGKSQAKLPDGDRCVSARAPRNRHARGTTHRAPVWSAITTVRPLLLACSASSDGLSPDFRCCSQQLCAGDLLGGRRELRARLVSAQSPGQVQPRTLARPRPRGWWQLRGPRGWTHEKHCLCAPHAAPQRRVVRW